MENKLTAENVWIKIAKTNVLRPTLKLNKRPRSPNIE